MKAMYTVLAGLVLACGSIGVTAQQQPGSAPGQGEPGSLFDALDRNGDGKLEKDEASAAGLSGNAFDQIDGNDDGIISDKEFDDYRNQGGPR